MIEEKELAQDVEIEILRQENVCLKDENERLKLAVRRAVRVLAQEILEQV